MADKSTFRDRLRQCLTYLTPERVVGVGGLTVLCAASFLALIPPIGQSFDAALGVWLGGLGLNVLASVLQQLYQGMITHPGEDEPERLAELAKSLAESIAEQPRLRKEMGAFLAETDALAIAEEVAKGDPTVHGWLLVKIYEDVSQYHDDFDRIHREHDEIRRLIESLALPRATGAPADLAPQRLSELAAPCPPHLFVDRDRELETLRSILLAPDPAVASAAICGMGGIGKTAMALRLGHDLAAHYPGGVVWIDVGTDATRESVLNALALRLGIPDNSSFELRCADIQASLQSRGCMLAVLDDIWDVGIGRWLMQRVLPSDRAVLVTSHDVVVGRALCHHVERIDPLPEGVSVQLMTRTLGSLGEYAGVARRVARLLGGLPLALELAAGLCTEGAQDLRWLLKQLETRPPLDILKLPGTEDRGTSVETCLAISYSRLDVDLRRRFRALGIFTTGAFDLSALTAIWGDQSTDVAEDAAHQLLRRSLLRQLPRSPQSPAYGQHRLLRAYALALLQREQEEAGIALRHRQYYEKIYLGDLIAQHVAWHDVYVPLRFTGTLKQGTAEVRPEDTAGPFSSPSMAVQAAQQVPKPGQTDFPQAAPTPTGGSQAPTPERQSDAEDTVSELDMRDLVLHHQRLLILGQPGTGKSTVLRWLTYEIALKARSDSRSPLPLLVPLSSYDGSKTILWHARAHLGELAPYLEDWLSQGRVMLLLDGLNEIAPQHRSAGVEGIRALLVQFPDVPIVVTCRANDYAHELQLRELHLVPLDRGQQRAFMSKHFGEDGERLFARLSGSEQLSSVLELATNPLALTLMAAMFKGTESLPVSRDALLDAYFDLALRQGILQCDQMLAQDDNARTLLRCLARLALAMQRAGDVTFVSKKWAMKQLATMGADPEHVLSLAVRADLLQIAEGHVCFAHKLVQEYLAARALSASLGTGEDWLPR